MLIRICQGGNPYLPIRNLVVRAKNKLVDNVVSRCISNSLKNLSKKVTGVAKKCFGKEDDDSIGIVESDEPTGIDRALYNLDLESEETSSDTELDTSTEAYFEDECENTPKKRYSNESIYDFVNKFLQPYISGKITVENEPKARKSMMEQLLNEIERDYYISAEEAEDIQDIAINAYFDIASSGILVKVRNGRLVHRIFYNEYSCKNILSVLRHDAEVILTQALKGALPKDFPERHFSNTEIESKIFLVFNRRFDNVMKIFT